MDVRKTGAPKNYTAIAKQYAEAVVRGDIAGSKWVRLDRSRSPESAVTFGFRDLKGKGATDIIQDLATMRLGGMFEVGTVNP
jgi:hypothetical protein